MVFSLSSTLLWALAGALSQTLIAFGGTLPLRHFFASALVTYALGEVAGRYFFKEYADDSELDGVERAERALTRVGLGVASPGILLWLAVLACWGNTPIFRFAFINLCFPLVWVGVGGLAFLLAIGSAMSRRLKM